MKSSQLIGCQQVLLHPEPDLRATLECACGEARKIYNCATDYARQLFFKEHRDVTRGELCSQMKQNCHFSAIYAPAAQQICNGVAEAFKSFQVLRDLFRADKLLCKPRPPNYRKPGLFTLFYPKKWLKLTTQGIRCPLGQKVKAWFGFQNFHIPMPSNLDWESIKEVRILPRNGCFYAEFVYPVSQQAAEVDPNRALGIDHGIDNWLILGGL